MGEDEAAVYILLIIFSGSIVLTAMGIYFKLKKRELGVREKELEMQDGNAELGPVVDTLRDDVNDTRAQLADTQEHTRALQERLQFAERLLATGRASQDDGLA